MGIDWEKLDCRFGHGGKRVAVVGLFHIPKGCVCYPDPVQALCRQHLITAESTGPIASIVWREGEEPKDGQLD